MRIRKYVAVAVAILLVLIIAAAVAYQWFYANKAGQTGQMYTENGVARLARVEEQALRVYTGGEWKDFEMRGIQLSSFHPGYEKNSGSVSEATVADWLQTIADIGANTIYVPYLQPPAFYSAVYDFNLGREAPLYILHSVPIDAETAMVFYNAYQPELVDNMWTDLRQTVDALHGQAVLLDNSRHHSGVYLKDVSNYVLGYIIGDNTSAEVITLTNQRFPETTSFQGSHYSLENSNAFNCFVAENLDFICEYEMSKYKTLSLYSYISTPETDPLSHRLETNATKHAVTDLESIVPARDDYRNLIACYAAAPNSPDFMDYDDADTPVETAEGEASGYQRYLERLVDYHSLPVLITGTGIPASRGTSRVDLDDGYDRGGHNEQQQGELIVGLLRDIKAAGCAGAAVQSFQDDWGLYSSFNVREHTDSESTTYWQDAQASDESFGLMEFVSGKEQPLCTVDGDPSEWSGRPLYEAEGLQVYAQCDTKYLYLMIRAEGWSLQRDQMYLALDVTPESGAARWEDRDLDLPFGADFIVHFNGYNESRIVVQERYNLFQYRYAYYSYVIDKQEEMPEKDSPVFSGINQMHRYNVILPDNTLAPVTYSQTGVLVHGTANPAHEDYNSLTDFSKDGDVTELRIPWTLINVRDPMSRTIQQDFYRDGLEGHLRFSRIGMAVVFQKENGPQLSGEAFSFRVPGMRNREYHSRLRHSAYILKAYWQETA